MTFDAIAAEYDRSFAAQRLGRMLRALVWEQLDTLVASGMRVLDLGCGSGEDTLHLARRGLAVTALDASAEMVALTQHKAKAAGLSDRVDAHCIDLVQLALEPRTENRELEARHLFCSTPLTLTPCPPLSLAGEGEPRSSGGEGVQHQLAPSVTTSFPVKGARHHFDGAISNFGALNCLAERRSLAEKLAMLIKPGGWLALVLMGHVCPWEIGWHLLRAQPNKAFRRRDGVAAHIGYGATIRVWYPSPAQLCEEFALWFRPVALRGIGVLLPPSYLAPLVSRRPRLFETLAGIERACAWRAAGLGDHYVLILARCT